jgi:GNAT superfamily N-acetyltransferase
MNIQIRLAEISDCPALLELMRGLAEFEGYLDQYSVTVQDLEQRGFPTSGAPEFHALIAEVNGELTGMLVYYFIPFTFDLRPTLFIKELFVPKQARGQHIGEKLFTAVREIAIRENCGRIKWDVLHDNVTAQRFYERQGARHDARWLGYVLKL